MTTTKITLPVSAFNKGALPKTKYESVIEFYNKATVDYAYWSKGFNMHYGYLNRWYEIVMRERMLENMNRRVFDKLELAEQAERVVDMGCGVGATCRALIRNRVSENAVGVNIVEEHIKMGHRLNRKEEMAEDIRLLLADYHHVPLPDECADGVTAVESMCHSMDKKRFLKEVHRLLKPGARFVVTDCFKRQSDDPKSALSKAAYDGFKDNWRVELADVNWMKEQLVAAGFTDINIEDARAHVAPSVMHTPHVVIRFFLGEWLKGKHIGRENLKNIKAVLQSIVLGLDNKTFSYFIVSAQKPQ